MSFAPLLQSGAAVSFPAFAALAALALGVLPFVLPKGGSRHRAVGHTWAAPMLAVAASSLAIHEIRLFGPRSPIHLLSLLVLATVPVAIAGARRGRIARHRRGMIQLFVLALLGAGAFTLLPGRVMHAVVFGP